MSFWTKDGIAVPSVTAEQMRKVDRIAMEDFGLGILQMMENAGRNLAQMVLDMLGQTGGTVTVLAGAGGNGGGGLCCARHLHNHGIQVRLALDREAQALTGAARNQLDILKAAGLRPEDPSQAGEAIARAQVVVDALIGYSLKGAPQGHTAELIDLCNYHAQRIISLDLPSGLDATSGKTPGVAISSDRVLMLALPKTGLEGWPAELFLADIGIPPAVYHPLGLFFEPFFGAEYWIQLYTVR